MLPTLVIVNIINIEHFCYYNEYSLIAKIINDIAKMQKL